MHLKHSLTSALALAAAGLLVAGSAVADDDGGGSLRRLSAEFQNNTSIGGTGEIFTTVAAGPSGTGGTVVYDKTVKIPDDVDVLYVTFSAQGDVHSGQALLMTATVNGGLIEPVLGQTAGGGGGPHLQTGWWTLVNLPRPASATSTTAQPNCNDGGGGTGDCHDNTIYFSGCTRILEDEHKDSKTARIQIKLANLVGGDNNISYYERSTIYIDGQKDQKGKLCKGVGTGPH